MGAKVVACNHAALLLRILPCSNRKHPLPDRGHSTDLRIGLYRNGVAGVCRVRPVELSCTTTEPRFDFYGGNSCKILRDLEHKSTASVPT
jgi:hypothetical protein